MKVLLLSLGQRTLMSGFRYEPFSGRSYGRSLVRGFTLPVPREPRPQSKNDFVVGEVDVQFGGRPEC